MARPSQRELTDAFRKANREIARLSDAWYQRGGTSTDFWKLPAIVKLSRERDRLARERDRLYPSELQPVPGTTRYRRRLLSKRALAHLDEVEAQYTRERALSKREEVEGSSPASLRAEHLERTIAPLGPWTPGLSRSAIEVLADAWEESGYLSRALSYRAAGEMRAERRKKRSA